jgi:hypothetical protein
MRIENKKYYYIILTLCMMLFLVPSCKKKKSEPVPQYPIPNVPVSVTIYPNDPTNFKIQAIGGWMYYSGAGLSGLVIYRKSQTEFVALDRTSPENPNVLASAVKVQGDNFTLKDTIKNATWQIVDGAVMLGSAWPLKLYGTVYDGNALLIRN